MAYHYGNPHLTEEEERERQRQRQMQAQQSRYSRPNTLPNPGIFARYLPLSTGLLGGAGLMMYPSELGHGMIRPGHIGPLVDGPDWPGLTPEQWDAETKRRYDEAIRDFEAESRRSMTVGGYTDNTGLLLALKKGLNAYRDLFGPTYNWNQPTPGAGGGGGGYTGEEGEENSGYETPGNPHKDKPVDLSDWLNENVPPLESAPEPPDFEMYKPPHWTEGLGEKDEHGMYKENVYGPRSWRRDGVQQVANLDYYNLAQDLIGEGSISPFAGEVDPWGNSDEYNAWVWSNVPTIHSDQEKQWQQAVDESQRRYDEMVAGMVETERLRQEEYAAERQRYTDMYNADSFFDNLDKNAPPSTSGGFNVFDMIPGTFESVIDMIDPVNTTPTVSPLGSALLDHFGIDQKYETPQEDIDALMGDILAE